MSRTCQITGKKPLVGNRVSKSNIKTKRKQFPNLQTLEGDFQKALMNCKLVVFYSFGTAMNHTMAANVPTVVYMAPDLMTPYEEAEPYFKSLRRCGVIHNDPKAAAAHINRIWDKLDNWWYSEEVQEARNVWVNQFARTSRLWWWEWIKALTKLKNIG